MGHGQSAIRIYVQQKSIYDRDNKYVQLTQEQAEAEGDKSLVSVVEDINQRDAKNGTIVVTVTMSFGFHKLGGDVQREKKWDSVISAYKSKAPLILNIEVTRNSNNQARHVHEEAVAYFERKVKENGWTHVQVNPKPFDLEKALKAHEKSNQRASLPLG